MIRAGFRSIRRGVLLPLAALGLVAALGGCVAYPAYPDYGSGYYNGGYYGGGTPYYGGSYPAGGYVEFGTGWRGGDRGHEWHEHREHERDEHRGWGDRR